MVLSHNDVVKKLIKVTAQVINYNLLICHTLICAYSRYIAR